MGDREICLAVGDQVGDGLAERRGELEAVAGEPAEEPGIGGGRCRADEGMAVGGVAVHVGRDPYRAGVEAGEKACHGVGDDGEGAGATLRSRLPGPGRSVNEAATAILTEPPSREGNAEMCTPALWRMATGNRFGR